MRESSSTWAGGMMTGLVINANHLWGVAQIVYSVIQQMVMLIIRYFPLPLPLCFTICFHCSSSGIQKSPRSSYYSEKRFHGVHLLRGLRCSQTNGGMDSSCFPPPTRTDQSAEWATHDHQTRAARRGNLHVHLPEQTRRNSHIDLTHCPTR